MSKCKACQEFFKRFSCGASRGLECDCPKGQGYCECYLTDLSQSDINTDMTTTYPTYRTVPTYILTNEEGCEPCTTDILCELFDFGVHSEDDLDGLLFGLDVGQERTIRCPWPMTLKRVS